MIWVAWRQFRTQALVTLGVLAAFAALVLATGLHLHDAYNAAGGAHCNARNDCPVLDGFETALSDLFGPALLAVPALLGMFWGAPLVARELESGTHRLAWTQTVTRRRWLSVRLVLVGLAALAVAGLASWLVSWWFAPVDAVNLNRFDPSVFTARGTVAVGYAGFAFALGLTAGIVFRRTLPSMVATLLGFVAVRFAFTYWIRPHLLPSREALFSVGLGKGVGFVSSASGVSVAPGLPPLPNAWMVSDTLVDRAHRTLSTPQLHDLLIRTCPAIASGAAPGKGPDAYSTACQARLSHHLAQLASYQPPSHYWPLQALETAIFLAVALALIAVAIWRIGPRAVRSPAIAESREGEQVARPLALKLVPGPRAASDLTEIARSDQRNRPT